MVVVQTLNGQFVNLYVQASDTIGHIRSRLQARVKARPDGHRLLFAGQPLEDDMTLGEVLHKLINEVLLQEACDDEFEEQGVKLWPKEDEGQVHADDGQPPIKKSRR